MIKFITQFFQHQHYPASAKLHTHWSSDSVWHLQCRCGHEWMEPVS